MATRRRPRLQNQGPNWRCKHGHKQIGWVSCTAYAMAMGIDSATDGALTPTGCEVRTFTKDFSKGLTLTQVANVAAEHYGVRVTVRTGRHAIAPAKAFEQIRLGRGFVLQGNAEAMLHTDFRSTKGQVNHAIWVNRVRGGTADRPQKEARVFDPAADGRHAGWGIAAQGPAWWPWELVLAFGASLRDDAGRKIGPGKLYAGFVPRRMTDVASRLASPDPAVLLLAGAKRTTPFPDRQRGDPPTGRRVNVRRDPRSLDPDDIVDRLSDGMLFVAFQRFDHGAKPGGSASGTWYGNQGGTEWIHESGLRHIGGKS